MMNWNSLKQRFDAGALLMVLLLWSCYLGYPLHLLHKSRWMLEGYRFPRYYFFFVLPMLAAAAAALTFTRRWGKWELLWWLLPLICLPGILHSDDVRWSLRQWLSWIIRGVIPGGIIFLTAHRKKLDTLLLYTVYPVILTASLLGLTELFLNYNPLWDGFDRSIAGTSQPANPFYRPEPIMLLSTPPRGTQGNKIIYASMIVGFLPLGLWLLKYKKKFYWAHFAAIGILFSIVLLARVRAVWIGALAMLMAIQFVGLHRKPREAVKIAAGALLCLGVFLAWPKTHDMLWTRFHSFHITEQSIRERLEVLQTAKVLKDHWMFGVGFGQFPTACRPYSPSTLVWNGTPDDQYFRWMLENGVLSTILLGAFFIGLVCAGWRKIVLMADIGQADFYKSILAGWLGIASSFLFFDGFYSGACNMTFWCFLGLFATCLSSQNINDV